MAEFDFDATRYDPGRKICDIMEARDYARLLWDQYWSDDDDMDPIAAFHWAAYDEDVYRALQSWAWAQDVDALSVEWQAALGRALGRKPPRPDKRAPAQHRRNARLRAIAIALEREYGLPIAQAERGGSTVCVASALLQNSAASGDFPFPF